MALGIEPQEAYSKYGVKIIQNFSRTHLRENNATLEDIGIDRRMILKQVLSKQNVRMWTVFHRWVLVNTVIKLYCDEMPESGIEESFPRQRTQTFPLQRLGKQLFS
jgi:hypothetical protein